MKIVIVTGMSGAGKSTALNMLEDEGYYCVDNMPISLIPKFAELADCQEQDLELAGAFLEMAARLIYLKTAALLPKPQEAGRSSAPSFMRWTP